MRFKSTYLEEDAPEPEPIPFYLLEDEMPGKRARSGSYRAMDTAAAAAVGGVGRKAIRSTVVKAKAKGLRSAIKKEVDRLAEHRTQYYAVSAPVMNPSSVTFNNAGGGWYPISPFSGFLSIGQGSTQGTRTGNKIRTMKATLKIVLRPAEFSAELNPNPKPQDIKIWFFRCKNQQNQTTLSNMTHFLQAGAGSLGLSGILTDINATVNSDLFTLLGTKVFKVGSAMYQGNPGPGGNPSWQYFGNNDYKWNVIRTFDVTKYLLKEYSFNDTDSTATQPMTVMLVESVNANGTVTPAEDYSTEMNFQLKYDYADF